MIEVVHHIYPELRGFLFGGFCFFLICIIYSEKEVSVNSPPQQDGVGRGRRI